MPGLSRGGGLIGLSGGLGGGGGFRPPPPVAWSDTFKNAEVVISGSGLVATSAAATHSAGRAVPSGAIGGATKRYWELTITTLAGDNDNGVGVCNASQTFANDAYLGSQANGIGYYSTGEVYLNNAVATTLATFAQGNVIGIALLGGGKIWFRVNGGNWNNSGSDNPATNSGGIDISALGTLYPAYDLRDSSVQTANFGASPFSFAPPGGFASFLGL